jgi:argininosuccinate lyase
MAAMLNNTEVLTNACAAASADPALLATDLADYLVRKGMPFRNAHHVVGAIVALAEKMKKKLNELSVEDYQAVDTNFGPDVHGVFDLRKALGLRNIIGAPGAAQVRKQLARWDKSLARGPKSKD